MGIFFHWLGGFCSATNFIPFRRIRRWSWEIYWLIQGVAAWLLAPMLLAWIFVPHLVSILRDSPARSIGYAVFFGASWGIGGLTFGLSVRYLGVALGYAIALGLCTAFGTLVPPIYSGAIRSILQHPSGQVIVLGVFVCLVAVAVNGWAGWSKEQELSGEERAHIGEREFSVVRGILVAVFAGIMSAFFAYGLAAGAPIAKVAGRYLAASGRSLVWRNLPVLIAVLWGGFLTNFVWSAFLIWRNHTMHQFAGAAGENPMRPGDRPDEQGAEPQACRLTAGTLINNYLLAALAGLFWYLQFFFYSLGETHMGRYAFSSWTLHMASIILFATLWGIALKEWSGTSIRTRVLVSLGLLGLVGSTVIVGYGNYLQSQGH
jgi:L-rhamnose-H+ transport protein